MIKQNSRKAPVYVCMHASKYSQVAGGFGVQDNHHWRALNKYSIPYEHILS